MLKIWELKKNAEQEKAQQHKRVSPARLRVQSDVSALELPPNMHVEFADPNDLMHFKLHFQPDSGLYAQGRFTFTFEIGQNYPIDPPKVRLLQKIYHPNIDLDGALCLNILREDWKPVLSLNHIAIGIQFLFLEPNKNDPLNRLAAASFQRDARHFALEVRASMRGEVVEGEKFDRVLW